MIDRRGFIAALVAGALGCALPPPTRLTARFMDWTTGRRETWVFDLERA